MGALKQRLDEAVKGMHEHDMAHIVVFAEYVRAREKKLVDDMMALSASSMDFWYNDIDDEVWNDA
ncbi:MAG: DUF2281 domain-containing protein [Clostridiales bacterium]|jgi:hypothetical protein|nr:DUF2281 domain-containing protein [Clostridiales bacterium]